MQLRYWLSKVTKVHNNTVLLYKFFLLSAQKVEYNINIALIYFTWRHYPCVLNYYYFIPLDFAQFILENGSWLMPYILPMSCWLGSDVQSMATKLQNETFRSYRFRSYGTIPKGYRKLEIRNISYKNLGEIWHASNGYIHRNLRAFFYCHFTKLPRFSWLFSEI